MTPEDFVGAVQGDLNSRRGQLTGIDVRGNAQVIRAVVPLATMFGYVNGLRSMTQGRATYTMQFSHYDRVPTTSPMGIVPRSCARRLVRERDRWPRRSSSGTSRT